MRTVRILHPGGLQAQRMRAREAGTDREVGPGRDILAASRR
jgi:hypothetical protein